MKLPPSKVNLPTSEKVEIENYVIPHSKLLVLSDVHIPYHDEKALEIAIQYGKDQGCNAVLLNGDIMDMYKCSRFDKDPKKADMRQEFEDTKTFLDYVRYHYPEAPIYYKIGNHEVRWEAYLRSKAPELLDMDEFRLDVILGFGERKINLITSPQFIKAGKLTILHGHEFGRSVFSPVNPARGAFTRGLSSTLAGHNHRTSEHSERTITDDIITCWSTGCLCELRPEYMRVNKWNLGFAIVDIKQDGQFTVYNKKILIDKKEMYHLH